MRTNIKNNLYKTITVSSIILASVNFAGAEGFSSFFKNVFFEDTKSDVRVENKIGTSTQEVKSDTKAETKNITRSIQVLDVNDNISTTTETDSSTSTDTVVCEVKTKILNRNNTAKVQMKKQTEDKNKIVLSLEKVASSSDATSSKIVQEKIIKLEKEFSDIVKVEKDITDIASTTVNIACDDDIANEKIVTKNLLKIKKLETEKDKQVDEVRVLIKKEIKNTLKSLIQS